MKRNPSILTAAILAGLLVPILARAHEPATNRLTFSARFGLNLSAKFSGTAPIAVPSPSRPIPNSTDLYNYDDGYVYPDVSGSSDGYTWYWGYDDSGAQLNAANNTILLHRSSGSATLNSPSMDDNPSPGAELTYTRELGASGQFRYGFEVAANYLKIGIDGGGSYALRGGQVTDAYAYVPGTTPPDATPSSPYQGTLDGPGFVIGASPASSTTTAGAVGTVTGSRDLDANLWGGRLGPCVEFNLITNVTLSLSGGLAVGWLDASVAWSEAVTFTGGGGLPTDAGSGSDNEWLWGYYVAANLYWHFSEHWSAAAGAQFQGLGTYSQTFGTRRVELDLSKSVFVTLGLSYNF
jgi:hypothetical protein